MLERVGKGSSIGRIVRPGEATAEFAETVEFWRRWLAKSTYRGRWREMVARSALTLKLLTYMPTGAIVAAPTTSLPEALGGPRNWDYRYTWIRDAAFTLYGFLRLGFTDEAGAFMGWLEQRIKERRAPPGRHGPAADHVRHRRPRAPARSSSCPTSRATATRSPCASATARRTSCSSTSTASCSTRSTSTTSTARRSPTTCGSSCAG